MGNENTQEQQAGSEGQSETESEALRGTVRGRGSEIQKASSEMEREGPPQK